ncbi:hypothetical protein BG262_09215 [Floricoccus penangensis]|uniref:Uncharacterized protein n=1 Tax=Floricoccus penangensis TaxID=1859475 RepID=A0A9Q5P123_9LACT|nr:hypothetical protein [Floricoccus penangensis]OFI47626.1 hypothetical protein BG262_09215 [Floricoccus penangensis]
MKEFILYKKKISTTFDIILAVVLPIIPIVAFFNTEGTGKIVWGAFALFCIVIFVPNIVRKLMALFNGGEVIARVTKTTVYESSSFISFIKKPIPWSSVQGLEMYGDGIQLILPPDRDGRVKIRVVDLPHFRKQTLVGQYNENGIFHSMENEEVFEIFNEFYSRYKKNQL